jgi:transmembrane sensor
VNDDPIMTPAEEDAAEWLFRHELGMTPDDERRFAEWLAQSEANARAWDQSKTALDGIGLDDDPFIAAMRVDALSARPKPRLAHGLMRAAMATAATLVVGAVAMLSWQTLHPTAPTGGSTQPVVAANAPVIYPAMATLRTIVLPDGTRATLDRQTALAVRYDARLRDVRLLRGQALFDVRHDGRTFAVHADNMTVTDTGTRFAVQLGPDAVVATLERGSVAVDRAGASVALVPGQQVISVAGKPMRVQRVDPATALAWSVAYVSFDDTPLAEAAARISVGSAKSIRVIGDATSLRVSGRFRADDPQGFAAAVSQALPLRWRIAHDGVIELIRRR